MKFATDEAFDQAKDEIIEKVILHVRCPKDFGLEPLTHEEISILFAKDRHSVVSKMAVCKTMQKALSKIRHKFAECGIKELDDVIDAFRYRETGSPARTQNYG